MNDARLRRGAGSTKRLLTQLWPGPPGLLVARTRTGTSRERDAVRGGVRCRRRGLAEGAEHAPVVGFVEAGELVEAEEGEGAAGVAADVVRVCEVAEGRGLRRRLRCGRGRGTARALCLAVHCAFEPASQSWESSISPPGSCSSARLGRSSRAW